MTAFSTMMPAMAPPAGKTVRACRKNRLIRRAAGVRPAQLDRIPLRSTGPRVLVKPAARVVREG
jgi:hypothetical protein